MTIHPYYFSAQKRSFDIGLAAILLLLLSPLLIVLAILIFITIGQPIIFKQKRTGKNGESFILFKFRTMAKNAAMLKQKYLHLNEAPAPMFKIHNDPRFIGLGKWLARTGFDELPQLWNILKGEMSFVGPRPLPISEAESLPEEWRLWRERVRPGVFSQWAMSGERHHSLETWKKLEKNTLQKGGFKEDFKQTFLSIKSILISPHR